MSKTRERARSPLPDWVENISSTDLQAKTGKTIPDGALSVTDRVKRYWGVGTINYRPNPDALRAARYEFYDNSTAEQRAAAKLKAVDQIAAVEENIDKLNRYYEPYDYGKTAAQARQATRPPGYPPFPITQQHILDAELQLKRIRMGYTQYRDHIEKSNALVAAEADYENLKRQFDLQEQKYPGAHLYPPYNTDRVYAISAPPLTPSQMSQYDRGDRGDRRRSGGKSKRVKRTKTCKSKRSNRSKTCKNRVHKRRN